MRYSDFGLLSLGIVYVSLVIVDNVNLLYFFHLLAHWVMTIYAQTCLECSNSLQPFHYLMVGMNLAFVLLYFTRCHIIPNGICKADTKNIGISGLFIIWILTTMRNRGILFDYLTPYYFSYVIVFNFWFEPLFNSISFVRKALALIFILNRCLVQTLLQESMHWKLLMKLMILTYYLLGNWNNVDLPLITSIIVAVFIALLVYGFPFLKNMEKIIIIMIMLIVLAGLLYFWNYRIDFLLLSLLDRYVSSFLILVFFNYFLQREE